MKGKREIRRKLNGLTMRTTMFMLAFAGLSLCSNAQNVAWKKNFGGSGQDYFTDVKTLSDGIVAVGYSQIASFGNGDWIGITGKGSPTDYYNATIIRFDNFGNVIWKNNFGSRNSYYYGVTIAPDGIIAVGQSNAFEQSDWKDVVGKGDGDAIIVKYNYNGNVLWKKNFGGSGGDNYYSVITVSDGIIAAGWSSYQSFGNGDWVGVTGESDDDAIIVKYDHNGNVLWKKSFGTNYRDYYESVTTVSDGVVAVGHKYRMYMGTSYNDAIIVKYDNNGNIVWDKVLGTANYRAVTTVSDGIIAVGNFADAIIAKYDNNGNMVWRKDLDGGSGDYFYNVMPVSDGIIAVGTSYGFGSGDWVDVTGKGKSDAIIVKYDNNGNVVWKKNFGGNDYDTYEAATAISDGLIVVGDSRTFGNGDWVGVAGKGDYDAIMVKYTENSTNTVGVNHYSPLRVYPNPTDGIFTIENGNLPVTIKLYNMLGQEVLTQTVNGKTEVNISHLLQGVYSVRIFSEGEVVENSKITKY